MSNLEQIKYKNSNTYDELWKMKDEDLSLPFCLSEFIDNSISSCEQTHWKNGNNNYELKIEIIFNKDKKEFIIIDNAGGMNFDQINNALILGDSNCCLDNTSKNQYGLGMKAAVFWLGNDAEIYTKTNETSEIYASFQSQNKSKYDSVQYLITENNGGKKIKTDSGTKIIIKNIYNQGRSIDEKELENIGFFLGNRYSKYLSKETTNKNKLNITIKSYEDASLFLCVETNDVYKDGIYKFDITKSNFDVENLKKFISEAISDEEQLKSFQDEILDKFISQKYFEFNDKIILKNGTKIDIKIMFSNQPNKRTSGLAITHSNRYIHHPASKNKSNDSEIGSGMYQPWGIGWANGHWRWVRGEISLENIPGNKKCNLIRPSKFKKKLIFDSENNEILKEDFDKSIKNVFMKWIYLYEKTIKYFVDKQKSCSTNPPLILE